MLLTEKEQNDFCREFNISESRFRESCLTWEVLDEIAEDFKLKKDEHQGTMAEYAEILRKCPDVHSLGLRVKDEKHLIEKIIRKNAKYMEQGESVSRDNYEEKITDIMGIRILLLFKEDWVSVHQHILDNFGDQFWEPPFAYVREGDDTSLYEEKVQVRKEKPYRSVHYVLRTPKGLAVEIQVRTLYEEAWSEIDHRFRYPYNLKDKMLENYLNIMNRLTGVGDEMGTFIHLYIKNFQEGMQAGVTDDNEVYQFILHELENCADENLKQAIESKIRQASTYKKMGKMSDLLKDILGYK